MSNELKEILNEFGKSLGKLKRAYAEEFGYNSNYLHIDISTDNDITIIPTNDHGDYCYHMREWVDTDVEE